MVRKKSAGGVLAVAVAAVLSLAYPMGAQAEPAVSGLNAKVSAFGGGGDFAGNGDRGLGGIAASITAPILLNLGLQVDGAYARLGDDNFFDTGAHLFWRDPAVGLIGIYGGYAHIDGFGGQDFGRVGAEAHRFLGNITFEGTAGIRFGDIPDRAYGSAKLQYYATDNLMFSGGYTYEGRSFGTLGAEYQLASRDGMGMALFADSQIGNRDTFTVLGGLRLFFGGNDSLISRHRRQDPGNYVLPDMTAGQQALSDAKTRQSRPAAAAPVCPFADPGSQCQLQIQCVGAGYTVASPGPAACGCAAVLGVVVPC